MPTTAANIPGAHYFTIAIASFFKFIAHSTTTALFDGPQRLGERQQRCIGQALSMVVAEGPGV
jgi:hypothetical protein